MVHGPRVSPPLFSAYERLRVLLEHNHDVPTRYAIGALVKEVKSAPDVYGSGAVMQLAAATGADLATLYRNASVASCWTLDEVGRLLAPHDTYSMSWSHLVAIATVDCREERAAWIERCLAQGLSVRPLEAMLAAASSAEHGPEGEALSRVERALRAAERLWEQAAELEAALPLGGVPERLLQRATVLHERMRSLTERQLRTLRRTYTFPRSSGAFSCVVDTTDRAETSD
jgi:hypothetical protein